MYTYPISVRVPKGWGVPSGSIYLQELYEEYDFVVRGVTRREYSTWLHEYPDVVEFEGKILREAVISSPTHFQGLLWDWDTCYAGVAQQVIEKIYNLSGFGTQADPAITMPVQNYLNSPEARFDLVIMTAYNYKLSELEEMDHRDWHMLVGLAQMKLEMMDIDTEAILYPERAKQRKGGIAVPRGRQLQEQGVDPRMAQGGAKPFFGPNARARDPDSPYPLGHPKNPAVVEDRSVPGLDGSMAFFSG